MHHRLLPKNGGCTKLPLDFFAFERELLFRGSAHLAEWPLLGLGSTKAGQRRLRGKLLGEKQNSQPKQLELRQSNGARGSLEAAELCGKGLGGRGARLHPHRQPGEATPDLQV